MSKETADCFVNCDRCGSAIPNVNLYGGARPTFRGFRTCEYALNGIEGKDYYLDADIEESGFFFLCDDCLDELSRFMSGTEVVE